MDEGSDTATPEDRRSEADGKSSREALAAIAAGLVAIVTLGALSGWLGYRTAQSRQGNSQREIYLQAGRQAALNLTTIDAQHADADVLRIVDSATGRFRDDFQQRAPALLAVAKRTQSSTVGTITEAGVEMATADAGQVLVTVSVVTTTAGGPKSQPRDWRMRIGVQKTGDDAKVSNVTFVQ